MLFREEFIDTCVKRVAQSSSMEHCCAICFETPTSPVTVCHSDQHIFCRDCILGWLQTPRGNNCPLCKKVLFHPTVHAPDDNPTVERLAWARRLAPTYPGSPPTAITDDQGQSPYDAGISFLDRREGYARNGSLTIRAGEVGTHSDIEEVSGVGRMPNLDRLCLHVRAMASVIRAHTRAHGSPFTPRHVAEWDEIVALTEEQLPYYAGRRLRNVRGFRCKLLKAVRQSWCEQNGRLAVSSAFLGWGRASELHLLYDYVAVMAWTEARNNGENANRSICHVM